jgi:acyl-CoA synthetase (AMP-forming)/AMP-acid ligase II
MLEVLQRIRIHAERHPQAVAIARRMSDGSYDETTYGELALEADAFGRALARHVAEGRVVPILAGKSAAAVAALIGASAAGCVPACLNPKLRVPQVERILEAGHAEIAVADGTGLLAFRGSIGPHSPIRAAQWWLLRGHGFGPMHEKAAESLRAVADVADWPLPDDGTKVLAPDPDLPAVCLFTSGSTGTPKGVLVGRQDLLERADAEVECFGLTERDVLLSVLPLSFDVGLNQLLSSLVAGATLVITDSWMPADILRAVAERGVTGVSAVPCIWQDFLRSGLRFDRAGVHGSLRYITVSGGDLDPANLAALPALCDGLRIFKTYGQTEVFRPTCLRPEEFAERMLSVGRPFGRSHVYVLREDGRVAKPGVHGEVVATGLGVMLGYLDGADVQNKLRDNPFRGAEDPGAKAVFTGDIGYLDEDGYLFLVGRSDAMLKIMGNRVYPDEVAAQLLALPGVLQAEVVGVRKADSATRLFAFVVQAPDAPAADELRRQMGTRVPAWMVPEIVFTKDAIPLTPSGKPDYPALVAEATAGAVAL